jgi:hypothetical protein
MHRIACAAKVATSGNAYGFAVASPLLLLLLSAGDSCTLVNLQD